MVYAQLGAGARTGSNFALRWISKCVIIVAEDKDTIAAGEYYIAAIDENGEVHVAYQTGREYYADVKDTSWENVDRLMKNAAFPVGISVDGEFIFPKGQSYEELAAAEQKMLEELPLGAVYGECHVADLNAAEKMQRGSWF